MTIGLVTCRELPEADHDQPLFAEALERNGIDWVSVPWDGEQVDLSRLDLLLIRSCWNYHLHHAEFMGWLEKAASKVALLNDMDTVKWNSDKRYLDDLASWGFKTVPTLWVEQGSDQRLSDVLSSSDWRSVVLKPSVSASSYMTGVFHEPLGGEAEEFLARLLERGAAMVQPYLSSVETVGERSVVCIDGVASHVVVKKPRLADGEESVSRGFEPTESEKELATDLLSRWGGHLLYARIDLMQADTGEWSVSELELIEPSLFLIQWPDAVQVFVDSIKRRVNAT